MTEVQRRNVARDKENELTILFRGQLWDAYEERRGRAPSPGTCIVCNRRHELTDCQRVAHLARK